MRVPLALAVALLVGSPGCLTIAYVDRLSESLRDLDSRGIQRSWLDGEVRVLQVRYTDWHDGETRVERFRFEPERPGEPLSTEEARQRLPESIPARHHVARWIVGSLAFPLTVVADLAAIPLVPFNVWLAFELDVLEFRYRW